MWIQKNEFVNMCGFKNAGGGNYFGKKQQLD